MRSRVCAKRLGVGIDLEKLPLDDAETYALLARGETPRRIPLANGGMTNYLVDLRPSTIHDINAMVALYRPGPMAFIPAYVERKKNRSLSGTSTRAWSRYSKNSHGVIVSGRHS